MHEPQFLYLKKEGTHDHMAGSVMCVMSVTEALGCLVSGLNILLMTRLTQLASRQDPHNSFPWGSRPCRSQPLSPFCFSKSQSLTNSLSTSDASQRGPPSEDEAKAETIRNLRKSFASLFSD